VPIFSFFPVRQILLERALAVVWSLAWRKTPVQTARAQAVGRRWSGRTADRKSKFAETFLFNIKRP